MGASRLPMRQIREILRLKYEGGLRHRAIARALGVGVGTVSEYVGRAQAVGARLAAPAGAGRRRSGGAAVRTGRAWA